jgi:hypothetical protein
MSLINRVVDERFLDHRRRSTSAAGVIGGVSAGALFLYRLYVDHRPEWDLFAVLAVIAGVKLALMAWYTRND